MLGVQNQVKIVFNNSYSFPGSVKTFRVCQGDAVVLSAVGGEDPDVCVTPAATPGGCQTSVEYTHEPVLTWQEFGRELGIADPSDPRSFIVNTTISNGDEAPEPIVASAQEPAGDSCGSKEGGESSEASAFLLIHNSCSGWAGEEELTLNEISSRVKGALVPWITLTGEGSHAGCFPNVPWTESCIVQAGTCHQFEVWCDGSQFQYRYFPIRDGLKVGAGLLFGTCVFDKGQNAVKVKF